MIGYNRYMIVTITNANAYAFIIVQDYSNAQWGP